MMVYMAAYSVLFWSLLVALVTSEMDVLKKRMAGGVSVEVSKYPFAVRIITCYRKRQLPHQAQHVEKCWTCTGSFIDIYGSVVTAAHCVAPIKSTRPPGANRGANRTVEWTFRRVELSWGVSKYPSRHQSSENVSDFTRIKLHPESHAKTRNLGSRDVDVAIIHLLTYYAKPMTTENGYVKLCRRKTTPPGVYPVGRVIGFGVQPFVMGSDTFTFKTTGQLYDINLLYSFQVMDEHDPNTTVNGNRITRSFAAVGTGHHPIGTDTLTFEGTCEGDDGAPYMFMSNGTFRLRAILTQSHPVGKLCTPAGEPDYMIDINYPPVRSWIEKLLKEREYIVTHESGIFPPTTTGLYTTGQ